MHAKSVLFELLLLPLLIVAAILSPIIVPVLLLLKATIPGFSAFARTSANRSWNLASYHSPHSMTWRWLINLSLGTVFSRPRLFVGRSGSPFAMFGFSIGIGGAHATTDNRGWQFGVWLLGLHLQIMQQRPMWYRDLYVRARDEADQLSGQLWVSDDHPHKVRVPRQPPSPTAPGSFALQ